jgi:hypothetical protein
MADKKITELTELGTIAQEDLFVVVDNPTGTPITKKITSASLFSTINFTTSTTTKEFIPITATLVAAANTALANSVLATAKFLTTANALSGNTPYQYGIIARSSLTAPTANVKSEHAAGKFTVDVSNAASLIANTYGLIVEFANTGVRTQNTQAFISFAERSQGVSNSTLYLIDVGQNGTANVTANLTTGSGNTNYMLINSTAVAAATHKLKIRVNGADFWLLIASNAT